MAKKREMSLLVIETRGDDSREQFHVNVATITPGDLGDHRFSHLAQG